MGSHNDTTAKVLVGTFAERDSKFAGEAGKRIGGGRILGRYDGGIPVGEINRLLFNFDALEVPSANLIPVTLESGEPFDTIIDGQAYRVNVVPNKKAIVRSDDFSELGRHGATYAAHHYEDWMLRKISNVVQGGLIIDNAGTLRNGAQAFVTIRLDEELHDGSTGLDFWPFLLAYTSLDGSLATTYSAGVRLPICDNMHQGYAAAAKAAGRQYKAKHTRYSTSANVVAGVQQALSIMDRAATGMVDFAQELTQIELSRKQWIQVLDIIEPPAAADASKVKVTKTENRRNLLDDFYVTSPMNAPWTGTAFGALQAVNSYEQHARMSRGMPAAERVFDRAIRGDLLDADVSALEAISKVVGRELVSA